MARAFDLVIFDCDGVLIDSELISAAMLVRTLGEQGVAIDLAYVRRHFLGRSYDVLPPRIRSDFGVSLPAGFEADYRARLLAEFDRSLDIVPGIDAVLRNLGVPSCVATSSSPERVARSLRITGLAAFFGQNVFSSAQVARGKPAPDLFLFAAGCMRADAARCLVFEDSDNGVRAGLEAGMQVCRFTGGCHMRDMDRRDADGAEVATLSDFSGFFDLFPDLRRYSERCPV